MNTAGAENWKRTFAVLWICVFLVCASYTMVVPFLPLFLVQELSLPAANAKMWSGAFLSIGQILALTGLVLILGGLQIYWTKVRQA